VREDEVYIEAKKALVARDWTLLAGQPPAGCDHLPVVEIKDPLRRALGSRGAFKPDLIAHKGGVILICECKPLFDADDEAKLIAVLADGKRLQELEEEMKGRKIWQRHQIRRPESGFLFRGALAYAGAYVDSALLSITFVNGSPRFVKPTVR
jgi:hypothetical protein